MELIIFIPIVVVLLPLAAWLGWFFNSKFGKNSINAAAEKAESIIQDGKKAVSYTHLTLPTSDLV